MGAFCGNCRNPVSMQDSFCNTCGYPFGENISTTPIDKVLCENCKAPMSVTDKYCRICGRTMPSIKVAKDQNIVQPSGPIPYSQEKRV